MNTNFTFGTIAPTPVAVPNTNTLTGLSNPERRDIMARNRYRMLLAVGQERTGMLEGGPPLPTESPQAESHDVYAGSASHAATQVVHAASQVKNK